MAGDAQRENEDNNMSRTERLAGNIKSVSTTGNIQQICGKHMPTHMNELGPKQTPGTFIRGAAV